MKYERKCSNCGRVDRYYAKGLCRTCYERMRRHGTFETQYRRGVGSRPELWSDKTKRILELYRGGMRQVDIVKEVGLTKQAVSLAIKKYAIPTNADRIRAMTDKELCAFLCDLTDCPVCPGSEACEDGCGWDKENKVMKGLYAWLKQEAEKNG